MKSAIADAKSAEYTEAEKKNARDRIGAEQKETWELLNDITLDTDRGDFSLTADTSGTPYNLRKLMLQVIFPSTAPAGYNYVGVNNASRVTIKSSTGATHRFAVFEAEANGQFIYQVSRYGAYDNTLGTSLARVPFITDKAINRINFSTYNGSVFNSGTVIKVYGVRA